MKYAIKFTDKSDPSNIKYMGFDNDYIYRTNLQLSIIDNVIQAIAFDTKEKAEEYWDKNKVYLDPKKDISCYNINICTVKVTVSDVCSLTY